ncbi:MAG: hypothetical protein CMP65_01275 [Flavobacteriales bacterium]|nr:hypothetical protein [Flavobacteriales bacterium]|tara:strand:- start:4944 stop:5324 length:381 start_codon:yes stop_codon:yes gene_type:complete
MNLGCGNDGNNGEVFLRIRAVLDETPLTASINNPDIPSDFAYDIFYKTSPGTYSFSYTDHNGVVHPQAGEYSFVDVIQDIGQEGGLFTDGEDGDDVYIDLWLLSTGAVIENNNYFTIASTADYPNQ